MAQCVQLALPIHTSIKAFKAVKNVLEAEITINNKMFVTVLQLNHFIQETNVLNVIYPNILIITINHVKIVQNIKYMILN